MGKRMPETCWAVLKRRAINVRDWCVWLFDLFECMMMHGLTNPKVITWVRSSNSAHISQSSLWLVGKGRGKSTRKCESVHYFIFWREFCFLLLYIYSCMIFVFTREVSWERKYYLSSLHMFGFWGWWCTIRSLCMKCNFYGRSIILTFKQGCWRLVVLR